MLLGALALGAGLVSAANVWEQQRKKADRKRKRGGAGRHMVRAQAARWCAGCCAVRLWHAGFCAVRPHGAQAPVLCDRGAQAVVVSAAPSGAYAARCMRAFTALCSSS